MVMKFNFREEKEVQPGRGEVKGLLVLHIPHTGLPLVNMAGRKLPIEEHKLGIFPSNSCSTQGQRVPFDSPSFITILPSRNYFIC